MYVHYAMIVHDRSQLAEPEYKRTPPGSVARDPVPNVGQFENLRCYQSIYGTLPFYVSIIS